MFCAIPIACFFEGASGSVSLMSSSMDWFLSFEARLLISFRALDPFLGLLSVYLAFYPHTTSWYQANPHRVCCRYLT